MKAQKHTHAIAAIYPGVALRSTYAMDAALARRNTSGISDNAKRWKSIGTSCEAIMPCMQISASVTPMNTTLFARISSNDGPPDLADTTPKLMETRTMAIAAAIMKPGVSELPICK